MNLYDELLGAKARSGSQTEASNNVPVSGKSAVAGGFGSKGPIRAEMLQDAFDLKMEYRRSDSGDEWRLEPAGGECFSLGRLSRLKLPLLSPDWQPLVEIEVQPWVQSPAVSAQIVRARIQGRELGHWRIEGRSLLRFALPPDVLGDQPVVLEIETPCFVRPAWLGAGSEIRAMGIGILSVRIRSDSDPETSAPAEAPQLQAQGADPQPVQAVYQFGPGGNGNALLKEGWYTAPDGAVWTGSRVSVIELPPLPEARGPLQLRLALSPMCIVGYLLSHRLTIVLNGLVIAQFKLTNETTVVVALPPEAIEPVGENRLVLRTPDAFSLKAFANGGDSSVGLLLDLLAVEEGNPDHSAALIRDDELNSVTPRAVEKQLVGLSGEELRSRIQELTGSSSAELFRRCESLGDGCSFGLAQRQAGVEVLGLLRFAYTPVGSLNRALRDEFKAATTPSEISVTLTGGNPREFFVWLNRYGIRWHTFTYENQSTLEAVTSDHVIKVPYLRRKFYETLRSGRKLHVICRANSRRSNMIVRGTAGAEYREGPIDPIRLAEAVAIWSEINRYARNSLLYVVAAQGAHRDGEVELLAPGLLRGYLSADIIRRANSATNWDISGWERLVAHAWHTLSHQP